MGYSGKDLPARNCAGCHRPLSRYNTEPYCGACAGTDRRSTDLSGTDPRKVDVGPRVRALRQRRGMTLEVLAGLCGVSTAYLSMIENGKRGFDPRYSMILTLASALRVTPAELLPGMPSEDPVLRRTFVGLTSALLLGAALEVAPNERPFDTEPLVSLLAAHFIGTERDEPGRPCGIAALEAAVSRARYQYQACRYSELVTALPPMLTDLNSARLSLDGEGRSQACSLTADAYHVAAGLLLKLGDRGLAYFAADRSMQAAWASEDPVTIAASARIIVHVLMSAGHLATAVSTAGDFASRLDRAVSCRSAESLSVYGSLLLRGAVAAAQHDQRAVAYELLGEAADAAGRLGADRNDRWTAFGPANATLHRVHIAVILGDAGTAIEAARHIDLSKVTVTERKASLFIDIARAFLQRGRHERALLALMTAHKIAHQEVAGRPAVHRLVREIAITAPPSLRRDATQFASYLGVAL